MLDLKSKYNVVYNGKTYGEEYWSNASIVCSTKHIIYRPVDTVPKTLDTNIFIIKDDTQVIIFQEPIIFDISDNDDGYSITRGRKNSIVYDRINKKIVNNNIDLELENLITSENLLIILNGLLYMIKDQNIDIYNIFNKELSKGFFLHQSYEVIESLINILKHNYLFDAFIKIWNDVPSIIIKSISDKTIIDTLQIEHNNDSISSLPDEALDFLKQHNISNITKNIRSLSEDDWSQIIRLTEILNSKHLKGSKIYYYEKLIESLDILLGYDYKINDIIEYSIKQTYLYPNTFSDVINAIDTFAYYVDNLNKLKFSYKNEYPQFLFKNNIVLSNNIGLLNTIIKDELSLINKDKKFIDNKTRDHFMEDLHQIKISNANLDIFIKEKEYDIIQINDFNDLISCIFNKYAFPKIIESFINKDNIYIIKKEENEILCITDKDNNIIFKFKKLESYNEEFDKIYNSL